MEIGEQGIDSRSERSTVIIEKMGIAEGEKLAVHCTSTPTKWQASSGLIGLEHFSSVLVNLCMW